MESGILGFLDSLTYSKFLHSFGKYGVAEFGDLFHMEKRRFRNPNWQANKLDISGVVPENSEKKIPKKELNFKIN